MKGYCQCPEMRFIHKGEEVRIPVRNNKWSEKLIKHNCEYCRERSAMAQKASQVAFKNLGGRSDLFRETKGRNDFTREFNEVMDQLGDPLHRKYYDRMREPDLATPSDPPEDQFKSLGQDDSWGGDSWNADERPSIIDLGVHGSDAGGDEGRNGDGVGEVAEGTGY